VFIPAFAGHAGATASLKLTFVVDHPAWADHRWPDELWTQSGKLLRSGGEDSDATLELTWAVFYGSIFDLAFAPIRSLRTLVTQCEDNFVLCSGEFS
jgi:hypothetical protein